MDWQFFATIATVFAAVAYLALRGVSTWRATKKTGCSGGCGCSKSAAPSPRLIAPESLVLRKRTP